MTDLAVTTGVAIAVGMAIGACTAYGQGWLGDSTNSLANSAGTWSLAAFLVARFARRVPIAVVAATVTLACSELGYAVATNVRGGSNATSTVVFWLTAALLAGPPLGVAGAWSRRQGIHHHVGFGVIAGVLIGEGLYGWTTVADTTDWRYWAVEMLLGMIMLVVVSVRRGARLRDRVAGLATGALTAAVVFVVARAA